MQEPLDTLVIGGRQAGLASGYHLKKAGLNFMILEAGIQPTGQVILSRKIRTNIPNAMKS